MRRMMALVFDLLDRRRGTPGDSTRPGRRRRRRSRRRAALGFVIDGDPWTYRVADGAVVAEPGVGDDAVTVVELSLLAWSDLVKLGRTAPALQIAGELTYRRGGFGHLHVRGLFDAGEVAGLDTEVNRLAAAARPGDDRSWWAFDAAGAEVLCRLVYTNLGSARIPALERDPRLLRLVGRAGCRRPGHDGPDGGGWACSSSRRAS